MPVENERKYLLPVAEQPATVVAAQERARMGGSVRLDRLRQAWVDGPRARVRRIEPEFGPIEHRFTWKRRVGDRPIEFETAIEPADFDALWTVAERGLAKLRLTPVATSEERWCLDIIASRSGAACLMVAEVEMPEGQDAPATLPEWLSARLLHAVPLSAGWSNFALAAPGAIDATIAAVRALANLIAAAPPLSDDVVAALLIRLGGPGTLAETKAVAAAVDRLMAAEPRRVVA
jgi:CYTH domain-containing protein